MMAWVYTGLGVGVLTVVLGVAADSLALIAFGALATPIFAAMAWYFRRRRRQGYFVP